jgi:uncharacterized membrane protein
MDYLVLEKYKDRSFKIASITSCSNVTGIRTPYHEVAKKCTSITDFVLLTLLVQDPMYTLICMEDSESYLDAILFAP